MAKRRKPMEYEEARRLRQAGLSIKRIARQVGASPSSVLAWTSDIQLTPAQHAENLRGPRGPLSPEALRLRGERWAARCRERRATYQEEGRARARHRDQLHLAGCLLYWAEGGKSRNQLDFSNSDSAMIAFFSRFLRESLGVPAEDIRLTINVYLGNDLAVEEIERYWLELTQLPQSAVRKHMLNHLPTSSSGRAKNKLPYGVCSLRVNSTRAVQHVFGAIQEYVGFDEPRWLD